LKTFEEIYQFIRPGESMLYSLVTKDRCKKIWEMFENVKDLKGDFIEIGCWRGGTASLIASQMKNFELKNSLFLCDTWSGIPNKISKIDAFYKEGFHHDATISQVTRLFFDLGLNDLNIEILEGIFPEETAKLIPESTKFKLVNLDVDIYTSAKECFTYLWPKIVSDGIVIIDDYLWPNTPGISKFIDEIKHEYLGKFIEIPCAKYQYILKKI